LAVESSKLEETVCLNGSGPVLSQKTGPSFGAFPCLWFI